MEGQQTFHNFLKHKYDDILADLNTGYKKMWCYYLNDQIVGVIATRDISHLSLLFVSKEHQGKGIAKELFHTVVQSLSNQKVHKITVNSSPYAVPIYEHIGFVATSIELENNGMRYTPMEYKLD
jgi:predicted GNAT family N-acyltransferase